MRSVLIGRGLIVAALGAAYVAAGGWGALAFTGFFVGVWVLGSYVAGRSEDAERQAVDKYRVQREQNGVKR